MRLVVSVLGLDFFEEALFLNTNSLDLVINSSLKFNHFYLDFVDMTKIRDLFDDNNQNTK